MNSVLPFDELNKFKEQLRARFGTGPLPKERKVEDDIIDSLLELLILAYAMGNNVTNENLSSNWKPTLDEVEEVVDKRIAGETWKERVRRWFDEGGAEEDIERIAETETHRVAVTSALETAKHGGATTKTWITMMDDRVREQHDWLEGVTIGIDDDFYAPDGSHAPAPGMFGVPEQDVNCRCELVFS